MSILIGFVAMRIAIRAIRQRESALEERAEEWEMFSGRVAHDLLGPLQVVALAMNLASERCKDEQLQKMSARGLSSLRRLRVTVDALLGFAKAGGRPAPGERAPARAVVAGLLDELSSSAEEHVIELSSELVPEVDVGERARFEVHDTGPGLDPGMEHRIFQPFVRGAITQVGGIGLGLATVKRMAEAHGGEVGVRSVKGTGSVFWVELPKAPPPRPQPPVSRMEDVPQPSNHA